MKAELTGRSTSPVRRLGWLASMLVAGATVLSLCALVRPARADGENAAEILAKARAVYTQATAYTATASSSHIQFLDRINNKVKKYEQQVAFKAPGMLKVTSTYIGEGVWHQVTSGQQLTELVNGTTNIISIPYMHLYSKSTNATALDSPLSQKVMGFEYLLRPADAQLSVMKHETINGRDAIIIVHGEIMKFPRNCWRVYIDSENYQLLEAQYLNQGSFTSGTITTTIYSDQRFNENAEVHDNLFTIKPPDMTPLAILLRKGKVTFTDRVQSPVALPFDRFVFSPDGAVTHFINDIGKKGTYELDGNRLLITMDGIVQVWDLEPNGVAMHAPSALGGYAYVFARD